MKIKNPKLIQFRVSFWKKKDKREKKEPNFLIVCTHTRAFGYGVDFASRGVGAAAAKKRDTNATNVVFPRDDAKKAEADSFQKNQR